MFVAYDLMPNNSKVWIYQANRKFSTDEMAILNTEITLFLNSWKRHGDDLRASYLVKYQQFIILFVDESYYQVSGCSIDASVNLMKQLENDFDIDLTNKLNISFRDNSNINIVTLADFQNFIKRKKITADTVVFNNMVTTKEDFKTNWEVVANKSWHKRFLIIDK